MNIGLQFDINTIFSIINYTYARVFCFLDPKVSVWYGGGEVDIILDDIQCNGSEDNLLQCIHGIEVHNCFYYEAAGVSCGNSFMLNIIIIIHNMEVTALLKWVPAEHFCRCSVTCGNLTPYGC